MKYLNSYLVFEVLDLTSISYDYTKINDLSYEIVSLYDKDEPHSEKEFNKFNLNFTQISNGAEYKINTTTKEIKITYLDPFKNIPRKESTKINGYLIELESIIKNKIKNIYSLFSTISEIVINFMNEQEPIAIIFSAGNMMDLENKKSFDIFNKLIKNNISKLNTKYDHYINENINGIYLIKQEYVESFINSITSKEEKEGLEMF